MAKKLGNLDSLQFALSSLIDQPIREDEFTADCFYNEAVKIEPNLRMSQAQNRLRAMLANGQLICRKIRYNGKSCNAYSKA